MDKFLSLVRRVKIKTILGLFNLVWKWNSTKMLVLESASLLASLTPLSLIMFASLRKHFRAWSRARFHKLRSSILNLQFVNSQSDPSFFIQHHGNESTLLLVYVDDILFAAYNPTAVHSLSSLHSTASSLERILAPCGSFWVFRLPHHLRVSFSPHLNTSLIFFTEATWLVQNRAVPLYIPQCLSPSIMVSPSLIHICTAARLGFCNMPQWHGPTWPLRSTECPNSCTSPLWLTGKPSSTFDETSRALFLMVFFFDPLPLCIFMHFPMQTGPDAQMIEGQPPLTFPWSQPHILEFKKTCHCSSFKHWSLI